MEFFGEFSRYILPALGIIILIIATVALLRRRLLAPPKAYLVSSMDGEAILLENWENAIGRSPTNDIILNYGTVSRFHAVIVWRKNNGWTLADTRSSTGTVLNGQPVTKKTAIYDGDSIAFGGAVYVFRDSLAYDTTN